MHHVVLESWSRGSSIIHAREARAKVVALLVFLVAVATTPVLSLTAAGGYAAILLTGVLMARLPLAGVLLRAAVVLPFSGAFAVVSLLAGDAMRAGSLVGKSYLSALAVLLVAGSTPLPNLLRGLERLGVPRLLILLVQFLYRYLFVISEQGQHMRQAAVCRGGFASRRRRWQAAAGALGVLFARSYGRAEGIHRAMLSRAFQGHFHSLKPVTATWRDGVFLAIATAFPVAWRWSLGSL